MGIRSITITSITSEIPDEPTCLERLHIFRGNLILDEEKQRLSFSLGWTTVSLEQPMANTIFDLESTLTFGKYRGRILEEVIEEDPRYVRWMLSDDGPDWLDLTPAAEEHLEAIEEDMGIEYDD